MSSVSRRVTASVASGSTRTPAVFPRPTSRCAGTRPRAAPSSPTTRCPRSGRTTRGGEGRRLPADYADHFGVTEKYLFNTTVTAVERDEDGWTITTDDGEIFELDGVVVANGHNWDSRWPNPQYPGRFNGEQMHAHDYRKAETFRDQRPGRRHGQPAMDIAVDASYVADDVMLSARHGSYIVPKYLFSRPADATNGALAVLPWKVRQVIAQTMLGFAVATAGLRLSSRRSNCSRTTRRSPTRSCTASLTARSAVRGIERFDGDSVVFTDGSVSRSTSSSGRPATASPFPFLSQDWLGDDAEAMPLYKRVFHTADPTLTFVGLMQSTGAAPSRSSRRSQAGRRLLRGDYALPRSPMWTRPSPRHTVTRSTAGVEASDDAHDFDHFIEMPKQSQRFQGATGSRSARAPHPASPCPPGPFNL